MLVTGGFHHFADPVAEQLGFERVVGNRLEVADGKLTGGLVGGDHRQLYQEGRAAGGTWQAGRGCDQPGAGDGANDIPMIEAATYGIAFRAKPKARAAANGWIDRGDLTAMLKLLEIREEEWVAGHG